MLVQRGKEPNKGKWSLPGGKLELGETALSGGQRELFEETRFDGQLNLSWYPETFMTLDTITTTTGSSTSTSSRRTISEEGKGEPSIEFHYLIGVCFANLELEHTTPLPEVSALDDASNAKWLSVEEILNNSNDELSTSLESLSPSLQRTIRRAEDLYSKGGFSLSNQTK